MYQTNELIMCKKVNKIDRIDGIYEIGESLRFGSATSKASNH